MARFELILTCDYEVFGDGSGHVMQCMIEPSNRIMEICEVHETRMTFFVDICEYWAFREIEEQGRFSPGYKPATWIREQIQDMVRRGHDVQMHMHPQWMHYEYRSDHEWKLNMKHWRLPEYIKSWREEERLERLTDLFTEAKGDLEDIAGYANQDYTCNAFRAGAWCIQPEQLVLQSLKNAGFKYDTSVAPGVARKDDLYDIDFTSVSPGSDAYPISNSVTEKTSSGGHIIEVPIATAETRLMSRVKWTARAMSLKLNNNACGCQGQPAYKATGEGALMRKINRLVNNNIEMLDFCGKSTSGKMISILESFIDSAEGDRSGGPIVAIGHPKNFGNDREFDAFIEAVKTMGNVKLESLNSPTFWSR